MREIYFPLSEATETPAETAEQQQQNNSEEQKCKVTTMMNQETTTSQATVEVIEHHPTNDEIEEYEESQRKFRELWEKKREKVSLMMIFPSLP